MSTQTDSAFKSRYGSWALVTGASAGIGAAFARSLAQRGFNLILVARRESRLRELASALTRQYQVECRVHVADLAVAQECELLIRTVDDIDIGLLVASAGYGTSGTLLNSTLQDELQMIDLNCRAVLHFVYHFGQRFAKRGSGGIVLMSSLLAFQGVPRAANYAATKAYIQVLAEGLREELKPMGVDVIASAPGPVYSGFAKRAKMYMSMAIEPTIVAEVTLSKLGHSRLVRPGALSMLLELSLAPLPRWMRTRILAKVMAGMTAHQL